MVVTFFELVLTFATMSYVLTKSVSSVVWCVVSHVWRTVKCAC